MKYTRCPTCNTVFRLSAEQLDARQGRVRCGQCAHVFNAYDHLGNSREELELQAPAPAMPDTGIVPAMLFSNRREMAREEPAPPPPPPPPPPQPAPPESEPSPFDLLRPRHEPQNAPKPEPAARPEATPAWEPPRDSGRDAAPLPPIAADALKDERPHHISARPAEAIPPADDVEDEPGQDSHDDGPAPIPAARNEGRLAWLWGLGIFLLAAGAVAQGTWVFRTELAMNYPNLRPVLVSWCDQLGCDMPLPKKADLIGIEASELRASPQGKGLLQLVATLRNRAGFTQAWPHLELTLTDTDDKPLVRRVFPPQEFLPPKADKAAGFPAGGDQALSLTLDPTSLTASGYRVYVFYP